MTLYDLLHGHGVTIQGNVRLSVWEKDEETMVKEIRLTDDLEFEELDEYENREILFMFAVYDGFLHIELSSYENE